MKQWLKRIVKADQSQENFQRQSNIFKDSNKKVIVSFDKHVQRRQFQKPNKNSQLNLNYQLQQDYQNDYCPRRMTNMSNCVQFDQEEFSHFSQQNNSQNPDGQKNSHAKNRDFKVKRLNDNRIYSTIQKDSDKKQQDLQQQCQNKSQQSSQTENYNERTQISRQIVNSLVGMQNLMKMIKNIPQIKGEYITLKHLNNLLVKKQDINQTQICNYMLSKSSQDLSSYFNRQSQKTNEKGYHRIMRKLMKRKLSEEQMHRSEEIMKFYFRKFSNGLIFQYYPVRALIWKIASGYLPDSKQKWIWKMQVSLLKYRELIKEHIIQVVLKKNKNLTRQNKINAEIKAKQMNQKVQTKEDKQAIVENRKKSQSFSDPLSRLNTLKKNQKDHPLNLKQNSKWKNYFEDYELWSLIQKDTIRTRQTCSFFKESNEFSLTNEEPLQSDIVSIELQNNEKVQFRLNQLHLSKSKKNCTTYIDSLTRIIFVFLKVHPQQKYYQGINELVAVIYYCFTNKNNQYFRRVSESDTYETFTILMNQLNIYPFHNSDHKKLPVFNHFNSGQKYFDLLKIMIQKYDFRLYDFLNNNKGFEYLKVISIRWFMSIFLSEFGLDEALILWDMVMVVLGNKLSDGSEQSRKHVLKDIKLTEFILYVALAVIHLNRNEIYPENAQQIRDCSNILITFQKIKQKPQQIIEKTINLYKSYPKLLQ